MFPEITNNRLETYIINTNTKQLSSPFTHTKSGFQSPKTTELGSEHTDINPSMFVI